MAETPEEINIPATLDGLEQALDRVLSGEEKLLEDIKEKLLHARIRHEYRLLKKKEGWGSSEKVRRILAKKYYNNAARADYIKEILYRKY